MNYASPRPVDAPQRFQIPKIDPLAANGDTPGWPSRGFQVAVMNGDAAGRLPAKRFDARLWLAWNDEGLDYWIDVIDDQIAETDSPLDFTQGTSIEIYSADVTGTEHWHATISPGVDPASPRMRISYWDDRSKTLRSVAPCMKVGAQKTLRGYSIEGVIPWSMGHFSPAIGKKAAFAVRINKPDAGHIAHLFWPAPWAPSADHALSLTLSDDASPAVTTAIDVDYERLHRTAISITTLADKSGSIAEVKLDGRPLINGPLQAPGRLAMAKFSLPMPAPGEHHPALEVRAGDEKLGKIELPDADALRLQYRTGLDLVANPAVFNQRNFPEIDFYSPPTPADVLGRYTVHATFYDAGYNPVTVADQPGRYGAVVEITPEFGEPFRRYITLYRAPIGFQLRSVHLPVALPLNESFGIDPAAASEQLNANSDFLDDEMRNSARRDDALATYLAGLSEIPPGSKNLPRRLGPIGRDIAWWYELKKKLGLLQPYRYLVHRPKGSQSKYPMILFLHGSGERGSSLAALERNALPKVLKTVPNWPFKDQFIVVSPQCPTGETWNPLLLRDLLDEVSAKYPVDADRVYLCGLSMGGFGTWDTAAWFPDRFAALAPCCGGGDPQDAGRLASLPIWVFHGGIDPVVPIQNSYEMVGALRDLHGRVRFTVYPDRGHNSWVPAFDDDRLYAWLLQQRRGQPSQERTNTAGTQPAEE